VERARDRRGRHREHIHARPQGFNLPLLVAGGSKLGVKLGQHLAFEQDKHPPLSNMLLSLAQKMGCETETFSDATGTLEGLVG